MGDSRGWRNREDPRQAPVKYRQLLYQDGNINCPFASSFRPSASRFSASCGRAALPCLGATANRYSLRTVACQNAHFRQTTGEMGEKRWNSPGSTSLPAALGAPAFWRTKKRLQDRIHTTENVSD